MKIYTIIAGVNGAGKSSLTGALKAERNDLGQIIDVDRITAYLGGNPVAGGKTALTRISECIKQGISFTQETTLSGVRTKKTIQQAKAAGYFIRLYYVGISSAEESIRRIENRVAKGGHNIPAKDVRRRFLARFSSLAEVLPYCDEAALFDNENGFVEVAEYKNGELLQKGMFCPDWLKELMGYIGMLPERKHPHK